jgi:thiol-disulfide isomerase/thioredoxin
MHSEQFVSKWRAAHPRRRVFMALAAMALAACGRNMVTEPDGSITQLHAGPQAPELAGGGAWVNSEPLTLAALRGRVVLIDFWTYGCINCRNTLPALRGWWNKYRDQGLVIIGVHTPEFAAEHDLANVRDAVARQQIEWPVVQDNDYAIWKAYNNRYWPHMYLIGKHGRIIYDHIGEGAYQATERQISAALSS